MWSVEFTFLFCSISQQIPSGNIHTHGQIKILFLSPKNFYEKSYFISSTSFFHIITSQITLSKRTLYEAPFKGGSSSSDTT